MENQNPAPASPDQNQSPTPSPGMSYNPSSAGPAPAPAATPMPVGPSSSPTVGQVPKSKKGLVAFIVIFIVLAGLGGVGYMAMQYLQNDKAAKTDSAPPLKVGVMFAFTGGSSSMGYGTMKGIQLAKKQLGADNIELVQMDSQCDKTVSPTAVKRLIDRGVVAIIGDGCSSASVAALPAAEAAKVLMVSPSASSPNLSTPNDYFYRVVPPDTFQGAFLAKTVYDKGLKTAAVFFTDEPYGQAITKVFKEKYEALGGKVVASQGAESDVIQLGTQIAAIKASKPQAVIVLPNSVSSGAAAIKLAKDAGITVPFFGGDGLYDRTLINNAGTAAEGLTITSFPVGTAAFKKMLLTEYQGEELYAASQAYDAFDAIYRAVKAGARTGEAIRTKLDTMDFVGVSGHIKFDANGEISDPDYKYDLLTVKDGSFAAQ